MTLEVYLDPSILSVPNMGQSSEEAHNLLKRVEDLAYMLNKRLPIKIISTYNLYEEVGVSYPNLALLSEFLDEHNLDNYSAQDLLKAFTIIFDNIQHASDDQYGEVLDGTMLSSSFDQSNFEVEVPNSFLQSVITCSLRRFSGANNFLLMPFVSEIENNHSVECDVRDISINGNRRAEALSYESEVFLISGLEDLESIEIAISSWKKSTNDSDFICSIWFGARATMRERYDELRNPSFSLGTEFVRSLADNEAMGEGRFSRITAKFCFSAVAGYQNASFGEVRFSDVRARDNAIPLRAQLNKGNPAKRIMVWKLPDDSFEFANVGPKRELEIEVGTNECARI